MASITTSQAYHISPLSANNYTSWSIKLEMLLTRSEVSDVVDGSTLAPNKSHVIRLLIGNYEILKYVHDLLLHCNEKQLISLCLLGTSKEVWDWLKQLYKKSNKAFRVNLHKQLCHLVMSETDDVSSFLESWQSVLHEAEIVGCIFTEDQQVNLLV